MKKLVLATLACTLILTACDKTQEAPVATEEATTQTQQPATEATEHDEDHEEAHEHDDHDEHGHEGHDHAKMGEPYQCGDKIAHILVADHEGETEAHLTIDDIEYELDADVQTTGRFTSNDDSIANDNKGMAMVIEGDKATITTLDNMPIIECTKTAEG